MKEPPLTPPRFLSYARSAAPALTGGGTAAYPRWENRKHFSPGGGGALSVTADRESLQQWKFQNFLFAGLNCMKSSPI